VSWGATTTEPSWAKTTAPGYEEPIVYWVPAIAISGLSMYNGDKFPNWKGSAFVGGVRGNTSRHVQRVWFNAKGVVNRGSARRSQPAHPRGRPGPDG
jgi:glucose/arabinose dehydrogenase